MPYCFIVWLLGPPGPTSLSFLYMVPYHGCLPSKPPVLGKHDPMNKCLFSFPSMLKIKPALGVEHPRLADSKQALAWTVLAFETGVGASRVGRDSALGCQSCSRAECSYLLERFPLCCTCRLISREPHVGWHVRVLPDFFVFLNLMLFDLCL